MAKWTVSQKTIDILGIQCPIRPIQQFKPLFKYDAPISLDNVFMTELFIAYSSFFCAELIIIYIHQFINWTSIPKIEY